MGVHLVAALAGLAVVGAAAAAPPRATRDDRGDLPLMSTITEPDWVRAPTSEDLANFYPPLAEVLNMPGEVSLTCLVGINQLLHGCVVDAEFPAGLGFGEATVLASTKFRMKPKTVDGRPVADGSVTIPLRWRLSDEPNYQQPSQSGGPTPSVSREALALARRIVAASGLQAQAAETLSAAAHLQIDDAMKRGAAAPAPVTQGRVLALLLEGAAPGLAGLADERAVAYAAHLAPAVLLEIAQFMEAPAGRAWTKEQSRTDAPGRVQSAQLINVWIAGQARARAAFCRTTACTAPPAPSGAK